MDINMKETSQVELVTEDDMEIVEATDRDIWDNKKSDDFLRYLKWEAFQYGYFITASWMNLFLYLSIDRDEKEEK